MVKVRLFGYFHISDLVAAECPFLGMIYHDDTAMEFARSALQDA